MEGEHAIGIDLGTTNCCVAVYRQGGVQIIPSSVGGNVTPSHISISDTNDITIGEVSKRDHKGDLGSHFYLMKRLIGRRFEDKDVQHDRKFWTFDAINEEGWPKILVNGSLHKPEEISALILKTLKEEAEEYVGGSVTKAVITVPAYFSSSQRQATKNAGRLAGLDVLRIINEPTAAALGYSYRFPPETPQDRNLLVFDLGGGTLDIVIIKLGMEGIMSVLAVGGDTHLGGEDIDNRMVSHCAREFERMYGIDPLQLVDDSEKAKSDVHLRLQRLKYECEVQKSFLAAANQAIINVDYFCEGKDLKVKIMRKQFNEMNAPMFEKCIEILDNVLKSTNIEKSAIDNIIVAGGSTKIPELRRRISEYFDGRKLNYEIHGDEAVAYGAALQAAFMTGTLHLPIEIQDVVPLPIGIDSFNRSTGQIEFFELIPKNTPLPCSKSARFSARHEGQDTILTNILEGTSKVPTENHLIATFNCSHVPHALTKRSELRIELSVNAEGILEISIRLDGKLLPDKLVIRDFLHPVAASDSTHLELFNINSSNVQVL